MSFDKFNDSAVFDPDKVESYEDLIDLRYQLRKAERMYYHPNPKHGREFWAFEIQEIQGQIAVLEQEIRPVLVKG